MSEADRPNSDFGSPQGSGPQNLTEPTACPVPLPTASSAETGWQTVDFPGAISIDAIPQGSVRQTDAAAQVQMAMAIADDLAALVERLRTENTDLRRQVAEAAASAIVTVSPESIVSEQFQAQLQAENEALKQQVSQLEADLTQAQIAAQLEAARNTHSDPTDAVQALTIAQEKLDRLFQELELSHQTNQRQQILAETLTEQLESSQERIAQLERDCAVTQQRLNEQVQQRLQAESACRDLRMRLHRQQQQTLQLKAALEKSLEMTPPFRSFPQEEAEDDRPELAETLTAVPRNQPVKPWAGAPLKSSRPNQGPPTPFAKLLEMGNLDPATPPAPEAAAAPSSPLEVEPVVPAPIAAESPVPELPAPELAPIEPVTAPAAGESIVTASLPDPLPPESIAVETNEPVVQPAAAPQLSMPQRLGDLLNQMFPAAAPVAPPPESLPAPVDRALDPSTAPIFDIGLFLAADEAAQAAAIETTNAAATSDDLWQDLEPLIGPASQPAADDRAPETAASLSIEPAQPAIPSRLPSAAEGSNPLSLNAPSAQPLSAPVADSPTQTALNFFRMAGAQPPVERATVSGAPLFTASSPSPILYPTRQPKKRQSLAAVELPRFPRKA